jgi:hypothetical protein
MTRSVGGFPPGFTLILRLHISSLFLEPGLRICVLYKIKMDNPGLSGTIANRGFFFFFFFLKRGGKEKCGLPASQLSGRLLIRKDSLPVFPVRHAVHPAVAPQAPPFPVPCHPVGRLWPWSSKGRGIEDGGDGRQRTTICDTSHAAGLQQEVTLLDGVEQRRDVLRVSPDAAQDLQRLRLGPLLQQAVELLVVGAHPLRLGALPLDGHEARLVRRGAVLAVDAAPLAVLTRRALAVALVMSAVVESNQETKTRFKKRKKKS